MKNEKNYLEKNNEDPSIKLVQELVSQGYQRCGTENLEETRFISGLFTNVEYQTVDQITQKYIDKYKKDGFSDVKIVPNYTKILDDWVESRPKVCTVYIK